ncbi:FAD-binding oxidoreductase [Pseudomonas sp. RT4P38]
MEGMGTMMQGMMGAPRKALYPSLMEFPDLPLKKRVQVESAAHERMQSGTQMMAEGLDRLVYTTPTDDYEAMQRAIALLREGAARFDSGLAAHRAIVEGHSGQRVALQWFKQEMNLTQGAAVPSTTGVLGVSWFHFFSMFGLVVFATATLWMYFLRMQRASLLLQHLAGVTGPGIGSQPTSSQEQAAPALTEPNVLEPVVGRGWSGKLRVGRIFQETPDVKTFRLMNPQGGVLPFNYLPGQYITVAAPINEKPVRRSYTIASSPTQLDYIEITVKHDPGGVVSGYLHSAACEGEFLECSGPAGSLIFTGRECKCILLIAGGVGITPLMSVLRYLLDRSWVGEIFLLYGCSTPENIIFREELEYLQRRHPNLRLVVTVSSHEGIDWQGPTGLITKALIAESVPDLPSRYVHICGPVPMMEATKQALAELGVPHVRIKTEAFGPAIGKVERAPHEYGLNDAQGRGDIPPVTWPVVTFADSDKSAPLPPDSVILEVAEVIGVDIDYSCRTGLCGLCRIKLLSGKVFMAVEDGLQPGDKENNIILACQAKALENISVKA